MSAPTDEGVGHAPHNAARQTGTVKWFNTTKGHGFIEPENGGGDVFVHSKAVERAGVGTLREDQRVRYERRPGRDGRFSAENLSANE